MRWFDQPALVDSINAGTAPLVLVVIMVVSLFLGGWAGFFLLISAIGNMISMSKGLERGQSSKDLIMKQIMGGILLLIFAYLAEGVIGYHGALGDLLVGKADWLQLIFHRGYHMETIHAVAWCVIINGIVQGILSRNGGHKKIKRNMMIYAVLAIIVIVATQFVWWGFDASVGGSFAQGINPMTGVEWYRGHLLYADPLTNILRIFQAPLAGQVEPLFPFLAVSFIGSIVGIYIIKQKNEPGPKSTKPIKRGILLGFILAIVGLFFVVILLLTSTGGDFFGDTLNLLSWGFDVTKINFEMNIMWLPWFVMVTGSQIGAILLVIRLVEYSGRAEGFAKRTLFFRRFGFVAFSVYTFQFFDVIPVFLLTLIPGIPSYGLQIFDPIMIWVAMLLIIVFWYVILALWEKVNYAFGMEWFIAKLSVILIPIKKRSKKEGLPWWKTQRLDPEASLHKAEWIDIVLKSEIDHENLRESKLAFKIALCGLIFFPAAFISIFLARWSRKTELDNKYNKRARIIGWIGIIITVVILVVVSIFTTALLA